MKLLYFFSTLIILYIIASQISVYHVSELDDNNKKELQERARLRSMLINNSVRHDALESGPIQKNSRNYKKNQQDLTPDYDVYPTKYELLDLIRINFVDGFQTFNKANQNITVENECTDDIKDTIINEMIRWNTVLKKNYGRADLIKINKFKCIHSINAGNETKVKGIVLIDYIGRDVQFEVLYHINETKSHNFLMEGAAQKSIILTDISFYDGTVKKTDDEYVPFLSMEKQMEYVRYINKMRNEEQYAY